MSFLKPTLLNIVLFVLLVLALSLPKTGMGEFYDGIPCSGEKEFHGFLNPFWSIDERHCQGKEAQTLYHLESWPRLLIMLIVVYSIAAGIDALYRKAKKQH